MRFRRLVFRPPFVSPSVRPFFRSQFTSTLAFKSRKENPQKLTQFSPRSHPRHLVGKGTAQKDAIKDVTSDSQVNSYFPYRWSPASLTINIYFFLLLLYLFITRVAINNGTSKITKEPKQKSRLRTTSNKIESIQITYFLKPLHP